MIACMLYMCMERGSAISDLAYGHMGVRHIGASTDPNPCESLQHGGRTHVGSASLADAGFVL